MATSFVASAAAGSFVPDRAASAVCGRPRSRVSTPSTVGHRAASIIRMRVGDAGADKSVSVKAEARQAGAEAGAGEGEPDLSALQVLQKSHDEGIKKGGAGAGTNNLWSPAPADDGAYDETAAVVSSGDAAVADEILAAVPTTGLPVTVVTGFLGSGKTTLLNWILTQDHGLRVAVLVNEFGSIDIDSQLVKASDWSSDDDMLKLANGCICCSINEPFVAAVEKILDQQDQFDYLVVETSGVADPVPVLNSLMSGELEERIRVDGILTVVDTDNFDSELFRRSETAISQLLSADTILLSKTDIADPESIEATTAFIRSVRPAARVLRSQRGRVPLHLILDTRIRMAGAAGAAASANAHDAAHGKADHAHDHDHSSHEHAHDHDHSSHKHAHGEEDHSCDDPCDHDHDHDHSSHAHKPSNHLESDGFMSASFTSAVPLSADTFMNGFLQRLPRGVYRAKGLLCFDDYPQRYIFQLSGRRYQFEEDDWPEGSNKVSQLVVIGRDLDVDEMRSRLDACRLGVAQETEAEVDAPAAASAA